MKSQQSRSARPGRKLQQQHLAIQAANGNAVAIHLSNGACLLGIVVASDSYMLLLGQTAQDPNPVAIYKHAVSAITPRTEGTPEPDPTRSPDFVRLYTPRTRSRKRAG